MHPAVYSGDGRYPGFRLAARRTRRAAFGSANDGAYRQVVLQETLPQRSDKTMPKQLRKRSRKRRRSLKADAGTGRERRARLPPASRIQVR